MSAVVFAVFCVVSVDAKAFNATAHKVIGHIAADRICTETKQAIKALEPDRSIAEAGLWADEIRDLDYWDALKPWHYMNIPDGVALEDAKRSRRGDVLLGIEKFGADMADSGLDRLDRTVAYRLYVHFVADIHQPLHVGRREDLGGNKINVRVDGRLTSLHAYWDGFDLATVDDDPRDYARYLQTLHRESPPPTDGVPRDWAAESLQQRTVAYGIPGQWVPALSDDYREKGINIINLRLFQAGVRLARGLDAAFCGATD